jgi:hypothetical protein
MSNEAPVEGPVVNWGLFKTRVRGAFTKEKSPAWLLLILMLLKEIPEWKSRYDFWLEAASKVSDPAGKIGNIIKSPFFYSRVGHVGGILSSF